MVRLLTFVEGEMLSDFKYLSQDMLIEFGQCLATICKSLSRYCLSQPLDITPNNLWDLRKADEVIRDLLPNVAAAVDTDKYVRVCHMHSLAAAALLPHKEKLRIQIVHADMAQYNIVARRDADTGALGGISGVIDFGDAMLSWVVGDLAVAITSGFDAAGWKSSCLLQTCEIVRGYQAVNPLTEEEVMSLWPLVVTRSIVNIACIQTELLRDPTNTYNLEGLENEW